MFVYKVILFVLVLVAFVSADIWKNCGDAKDHIQIRGVVITPDPPVKGKNIHVVLNATLNEVVAAGTVALDLKLGPITIFKKTLPLCSLVKPFRPCPIEPGPIDIAIDELIPSAIPSGHYSGNVKAHDQNNEELACISLDLRL